MVLDYNMAIYLVIIIYKFFVKKKNVLAEVFMEACIPYKATKSLVESPWFWKLEIRPLRLEFAAGMVLVALANAKYAVNESLLPSFTSHSGPPSYYIC